MELSQWCGLPSWPTEPVSTRCWAGRAPRQLGDIASAGLPLSQREDSVHGLPRGPVFAEKSSVPSVSTSTPLVARHRFLPARTCPPTLPSVWFSPFMTITCRMGECEVTDVMSEPSNKEREVVDGVTQVATGHADVPASRQKQVPVRLSRDVHRANVWRIKTLHQKTTSDAKPKCVAATQRFI